MLPKLIKTMIFNSGQLKPTRTLNVPVLTILTILTAVALVVGLVLLITAQLLEAFLAFTCSLIGIFLIVARARFLKDV